MKNEDLTTRWDSLLVERAALEQERHEALVATGLVATAIEDRLETIREGMAALDEVFQGQEHPNANADFEEVFRPAEVTAAFNAAFGIDPDAPENWLGAFRNARKKIEDKGTILPEDLEQLRTIDQGIAQAQFDIHKAALEYWRNIDVEHPNVRENQDALDAITAKYPDLVDLAPVAPEAVANVGSVAVGADNDTDQDGITIEEVEAYPRDQIPALLSGKHKARSQIRSWNRALDALKLSLGGLKQEAVYHRIVPDGQSKGGDAARQAREWISHGREIVLSKRKK